MRPSFVFGPTCLGGLRLWLAGAAQNNAAIHRHGVELKRGAVAVLVVLGCKNNLVCATFVTPNLY